MPHSYLPPGIALYLLPVMLSTSYTTRPTHAQAPYHLVPGHPVPVQHQELQLGGGDVSLTAWKIKDERFIVDRIETPLLDMCLLLGNPLPIMMQVYLDIGICNTQYKPFFFTTLVLLTWQPWQVHPRKIPRLQDHTGHPTCPWLMTERDQQLSQASLTSQLAIVLIISTGLVFLTNLWSPRSDVTDQLKWVNGAVSKVKTFQFQQHLANHIVTAKPVGSQNFKVKRKNLETMKMTNYEKETKVTWSLLKWIP